MKGCGFFSKGAINESVPAWMTKQRGAAVVEFLIAMLGLGVLSLGGIQFSLIYNAKSVLNNATFEAARAGAVYNAQRSEMRKALARNLIPLYVHRKNTTIENPSSGNPTMLDFATAYGKAWAELRLQEGLRSANNINIISPSKQAFDDAEIYREINGRREIPNEHLLHKDHSRKSTSGLSLQDANILKIEVTYGYKLTVPIANKIITSTMTVLDPGNAGFYRLGYLPIVAQSTVRMQSNAYADGNADIPPVNVGATTSDGSSPENK